MESKKLSFNGKFVFRETLRHWPFIAAIAAVYLLTVTGLIGMFPYFDSSAENVVGDVIRQLMDVSQAVSFFMSILVADFAFGYLGSKKSHYFYETLPMNRKSMFVNRFVFGYLLLFIPNFFIAVIEFIQIAFISGEAVIMPLVCWLLIIAAENLFWLTFGTLFMVLCGRKLMAAFCYFAFAGLGFMIKLTFAALNSAMFIGFESSFSDGVIIDLGILSPFEFIYKMDYVSDQNFFSISEYYGAGRLVTVFVAFAILLVITYILYNKRKAEKTGDTIVFPFMKYVFSWCFAFVFSVEFVFLTLGLFFYENDGMAHITSIRIFVVIMMIVFSFIGYMISCMIINKKLNVFKNHLKPSLVCAGVLALFIGLYMHDIFGYEKFVPEVQEVASVRVMGAQFNNDLSYFDHNEKKKVSTKEKETVVKLQQIIIDNFDEVIENYKGIQKEEFDYVDPSHNKKYDHYVNVNENMVYIDFILSNDKHVYRDYYIKPSGKLYEELKAFVNENSDVFKPGDAQKNYYFENAKLDEDIK
ncbi:MAG: hypothetical protein IKW90_06030 [Lachnospiraceae bacterium]|nr:hypothetical protein [Lachnospiraceae bacterium]